MSQFDDLRKSFGVAPMGSGGSDKKSSFDDLRMSFGLIPDTRPTFQQRTQQQFGGFPAIDAGQSSLMQKASQYAAQHPLPQQQDQQDSGFHIPILDSFNQNVLEPASNFLNRAAVSAVDALTFGQSKKAFQQAPEPIKAPFEQSLQPAQTTAEKTADIVGTLYGSLAPTMGAYATGGKLAAQGLARLAPNAPRILQNLVRGAGAGLTYGAANEAVDAATGGDATLGQRAANIGMDAALFGGGDAALGLAGAGLSKLAERYAGTKLGDALNKIVGNAAPTPEAPAANNDFLALPPGRRSGFEEATQRAQGSILPTNDNPIANPHTFALNEAQPGTIAHTNNVQDALSAINEIDNELRMMDSGYQKALNDQYQLLKTQRDNRGGVQQGSLTWDENGNVTGRTGRISNNPQWYQEFFKENNKRPSNKDLYQLAQKHVNEGYMDNGMQIPSWHEQTGYHETKASLEQVKNELTNYVKGNGLGITDATLKGEVLKGIPKPGAQESAAASALKAKIPAPKQLSDQQIMDNLLKSEPKPVVNSGLKGEILKSSPEPVPGPVKINDTPENPLLANSDLWKNKGKLSLGRETMTRNFEDMMPKEDAAKMKATYIEPIGKSEADRQRFLQATKDKIKSFGIKYKSKEDQLVQKYGEGLISLDELKQQSPQNWEKVKSTAESMRNMYDNLLTKVNESLTRNGYDPIPKRENYFPHYQEIDNLLSKFGIKLENHELPTDINGLSADFKPGKNFFRHALQRKGNQTTYGFLEGADRYLEGISRLIHHTDNIKALRGLESDIRTKYEGKTHLSDFAANLTDFTNALAGKKSRLDRGAEEVIGRKLYAVVDAMRRRVGANAVGGSLSSALTNFIPLTQSLATTDKEAFAKGMLETLRSVIKDDGFAQKSDFLARRESADPLAADIWYKAADKAAWLFKAIDRFTSQTVVRSKFLEGKKMGLGDAEAMHRADDWAARLMTDRSFGAQPTMFNSRVLGLFTQFQAEVNNQMSFLFKDIPRSSKNTAAAASALGQVFLYSYLFNTIYEKLTGNRPAFDPIGIAVNAAEDFTNPNLKKGKAATNLMQNVANNVPFLSTVVGGGRIPLTGAFPNVTKLIDGSADVKKELEKPLFGMIMPFGGNQLKKTIQGVSDLNQGGSYTESNGKQVMRYPIADTPMNKLRGAVFGANSFPEAQNYYRNGLTPLTPNQTKSVESSSNPSSTYDKIKVTSKIESNIDKVKKDPTLSNYQKSQLIRQYQEQLRQSAGR